MTTPDMPGSGNSGGPPAPAPNEPAGAVARAPDEPAGAVARGPGGPGLATTSELAELRRTVAALTRRVEHLEQQARQQISEDTLLVISAAVAAYLGHRASVKHVHLRRGGQWAAQARTAAQFSPSDLRGRR